jgi:polar amino acid transport system ATP-binding protein
VITVDAVTKRYGTRTVLDGISLRADKGDVVALVGPSGGGKSTLLRTLNGLEAIDGGEIRVGDAVLRPGRGPDNERSLRAIRARVGFVFQQFHLFTHRSVIGNVIEAPVHVKKTSVKDATARAKALLEKVGMTHREDAYPHELSGGEQQRVAIARALAMDPEVLLLDEPTSALDPERVDDVIKLLGALAKEGLTLILVTHEMAFARRMASRVVVLYGGHIVEEGPPDEVLGAPKHERTRAFLGLDVGSRAAG